MNLRNIMVGLPVKDVDEASRWYEQCLELKRGIDPAPGRREFELFPGCWMLLSEAETTASQHRLLLAVADLEDERERLKNLGVQVSEIQRVERVAWCNFQDPDGNNFSLYRVDESIR